MIVTTVRDELDHRHPLRTTLAELHRTAHPVWITLAGLSPNEIAAFASVDRGVAWAIHRLTEGNPFFVDEIVHHLRERDCLDEASVDTLPLPRGVRETVEARLAGLPEHEMRVLRHAAVIGQEFELAVLARMVDQTEDELVDPLDHALLARLVIEVDGADRYRFTHALLRQALYESVSVVRSRRLHARAATAIEDVHGDDINRFLPELASHCRAAGPAVPVERTLDLSVRAGMVCRDALAYTEAAGHWATALELLPKTAATDPTRARLHEMLGQLLFSTGVDRSAGIRHLETSLALYERLDNPSSAARLHCRLGLTLASLPTFMDIPAALDHYRSARAVLDDKPSVPLASHLYTGLSGAALYSLDNAEGLDAASRAIENADASGHGNARALARALHGAHRAYLGQVAEGFAELEQAWATADATDDAIASFFAAWMRGWGAVLLLNPVDAQTWFQRELASDRIESMPRNRDTFRAMGAICELLMGLPIGADVVDSDPSTDAPLYRPLLAMRRGDWDLALERLVHSRESLRKAGNRADECTIAYWIGHLHLLRGDHDDAAAVLTDILADVQASDTARPYHEILLRSELARLGVDPSANLERSCGAMASGNWYGLAGRVALARAAMAGSAGMPDDEVDTRFRNARDQFRSLGLRWDEAETLDEWAAAYERAGRSDDADRTREAAVVLYRSIGAEGPWIDRIGARA